MGPAGAKVSQTPPGLNVMKLDSLEISPFCRGLAAPGSKTDNCLSVIPQQPCARALSHQDTPHWEADDEVCQGQRLSSMMFSPRLLKRKINK